jgi:amino acid transporter
MQDAGRRGAGHTGSGPESNQPEWLKPGPTTTGSSPDLPETSGYKIKRKLLGRPISNEDLQSERLGKPTALAVLSSDVMSSAAYASESVLRILVPVAGLGAFALITPITALLLLVLGVVCLCYRNVVEAYPVSGGSYVVSRDNFGFSAAQIPGAALLCSYTLTVAVSVAAGVDAVLSAFPGLSISPTILSVAAVLLLTFGNLRGIREAGRVFAVPTYWFLLSMFGLIAVAAYKYIVHGTLAHVPAVAHQMVARSAGPGLLLGASVFIFLRAFANGGSAMTGMEAISNAVTVFREPQVRNARQTLLLMAAIIGFLFLAVSAIAGLTHAIPFVSGTPTVLSEIGTLLFGTSTIGKIAYYSLQFSTALILILGANTSFNGFPLLVSFIAQDSYLPRRLTTRGHRAVYSNGVLLLTVLSVALLVVTHADVASLIPLYATTVFTGFTMAGAGMTRYHMKNTGPDRTRGLIVNGLAFFTSAVVTLIFVITEFSRGAWAVVVVIPLLVFMLSRTHKRYEVEREVLAEEIAPAAIRAPILRQQVVVVLVDRVDLPTAGGLQLARSVAAGGRIRAVHFSIDDERTDRLTRAWTKLGLGAVPLEVIECPDRRLVRSVTEMAADLAADGHTEVLLILPRRATRGVVNRLLHDQTADRIVSAVTGIRNVSATIAPFDIGRILETHPVRGSREEPSRPTAQEGPETLASGPAQDARYAAIAGTTPLGEVTYRRRTRVVGRVRSVSVGPLSGAPTFECVLVDGSGALTVVFLGRRSVAGIDIGKSLVVEGTIGAHRGKLAMLNPIYDFLVEGEEAQEAV